MKQTQRTSKGSDEKIHIDEKIRLGIMLVFEAIEWRSRHTPSWQHTKSLFKPQKTECCNECYDLFYVKAQQQEEGYLINAAEKLKQEQEYDEQIKRLNKKRSSWIEGKMIKLNSGHKDKKKCGKPYCRHRLADHNLKIPYENYRGKIVYDLGCSKCACDKMRNKKTRPNPLSFANKIRKGMEWLSIELCNHNEVFYVWEPVWNGRDYRLGDRLVDLPFTAYIGSHINND